MKRSELIIGGAYYRSRYNDWIGDVYGRYPNLTKLAISQRGKKVIVVETQLKTEYDRKYRTREVLVRDINGKESWIPLTHLRGEFDFCIKTLFGYKKEIDGREARYKAHLDRKHDREQYKPALRTMLETMKELTGDSVSTWSRVEAAFTLEQLQTINEALSLLKTQKPALKEVA